MKIGTKLRQIRQLKGFSQEYVASKLGMSQNNYSKIELEQIDVKLEFLDKFAEIHEIDPMDVLQFNDHYIFNNHNQQGGGFGSSVSIYNQYSEKIIELYERQIEWFKTENSQLKEEIKTLQQQQHKQKRGYNP